MSMTPNNDDLRPEEFPAEPLPEENSSSNNLKRRVYLGFAGCVALGLAVAGMYIGGRLFAKPKAKWEPVTVSQTAHPGGLPKASPLDVKKDAAKPEATPQPEAAKPEAAGPAPAKEEAKTEPTKAEPVAAQPVKPEPAKQEIAKVKLPDAKVPDVKAAPAPSQPAPAAKPQLVSQTTPAPNAQASGVWNLINPKTGDRFLQLAALGPGYADKYVTSLQGKGIRASVAPGPTENVYRILVGPFQDQGSLERQHDVLEAAGIHPMLRVY